MTHSWSKTVIPIAAIFSFRMLGLFLMIPIFSVYTAQLHNATPTLIGIALGSYGLTQGLFQIPFGMLSDKLGRKSIITMGLILFAIGSVIGAGSHSIYGIIIGRTLQGMGAIGSVLIALVADLTPDAQRTKAMAFIGMTIGISFSLAMIISPSISSHFGLSGIFYLTAILALLGIVLLHTLIPTPSKGVFPADTKTNSNLFKSVLANPQLQRLNIGIFCQHFILTATFFAVPIILSQPIKMTYITQQWHFYLPLIVGSFLCMIPFITLAEKKKKGNCIFLLAVGTTSASQALLAWNYSGWISFCVLMFLYFVAFNILEASLPSLISKQAHPKAKGTAMGIYSTGQFLGIFAGGSLSGIVYQWSGSQGIFVINGVIAFFWFIIACFMKSTDSNRML